MSNVRDVRPSSRERQSHWTVAGPLGVPVEFDAEVSAFVANEVFAWRTIEGSPVAHAGLVRFEPAGAGQTRVHIRMSYNPPGGWLGHGVAAAFGADPKRSLDGDLVRMKTLIETGRPPRDAARPTLVRQSRLNRNNQTGGSYGQTRPGRHDSGSGVLYAEHDARSSRQVDGPE
jgi:uncharacterized membrane protein